MAVWPFENILFFALKFTPIMKATLILVLWLPLAVGCKKNELNALPPETQVGANTFGCLVNGKAWVPKKGGLCTDPSLLGVYALVGNRRNLWIQATNTDGSGLDFLGGKSLGNR